MGQVDEPDAPVRLERRPPVRRPPWPAAATELAWHFALMLAAFAFCGALGLLCAWAFGIPH